MGLPWFKCYPSDLLGSYRWQMMSAAERGAYWHLICLQMNSPDGTIHGDLDRLSALCGHRIEAGSLLEQSFPVVSAGRRANLRAAEEYQKRDNKIETNKANGARGGRPKKNPNDNPKITHAITHDKTDPDPDPDPDIRAKKSEKDSLALSQAKSAEGFDEFWSAYPKKRSKGQAEKAWQKIKPDASTFRRIIEAIEIHKRSNDWQKESGAYIPYPATWLNAKCWEDEINLDKGTPWEGAL
jgi:hypothetical protein